MSATDPEIQPDAACPAEFSDLERQALTEMATMLRNELRYERYGFCEAERYVESRAAGIRLKGICSEMGSPGVQDFGARIMSELEAGRSVLPDGWHRWRRRISKKQLKADFAVMEAAGWPQDEDEESSEAVANV